MIRTNKTTIGTALGMPALMLVLGVAGFAADEKAVPATSVATAGPKFERFDPAKYTGETGRITLPIAGQAARLVLRKVEDGKLGGYLEVKDAGLKDAALTVPVGSYRVAYYYLKVIDKNGTVLILTNTGSDEEEGQMLEINAGESAALEMPGQLVESIRAGKTGRIIVPYDDGDSSLLLRVADEKGIHVGLAVTSKSSEVDVPAGKYRLESYTSTATARDKTRWYVTIDNISGQDGEIEVAPTKDVKIKAIESLVASVVVSQNGGLVSMAVRIVAGNGERCSLRPFDANAQPLSFKVLSKSGEVLMSGKFEGG